MTEQKKKIDRVEEILNYIEKKYGSGTANAIKKELATIIKSTKCKHSWKFADSYSKEKENI